MYRIKVFAFSLALAVLHAVRLVRRLAVYWQVGGLQDIGIARYYPASLFAF
jgi:hypothetical protein